MSQGIYGTVDDNALPSPARASWRRTASTLMQLATVALAAVVIGIYVFPVE